MAVDDIYTKVLLHLNGNDASNTITDESGKSWTASGGAQIDTAQSVFGGASLLLDGANDYISTPDSDDFVLGAKNWNFDFRTRFANLGTGNPGWVLQYVDINNFFAIFRNPALNLIQCQLKVGGATIWYFTAPWAPSINTWYHVTVGRNGDTPIIGVGGTLLSVTEGTTIAGKSASNLAAAFWVGRGISEYHNGWIDEFRYSLDICRWTANFTPPTIEYAPLGGNQVIFFD